MKKKIYIVIKDCVEDYERDMTVEPYGSLDEAVAEFTNLTGCYRCAAQDLDWKIEEDTPHDFSAYEEGYESHNHFYIKLQISEINI